MIGLSSGVRVLLATQPVDFRKGAHGLAALRPRCWVTTRLQA